MRVGGDDEGETGDGTERVEGSGGSVRGGTIDGIDGDRCRSVPEEASRRRDDSTTMRCGWDARTMPIGASEDATREGRRARDRGRDAGVRAIGERARSGDARGWGPSDGGGAHGARGASAHLLGVVARPGAESERGSRDLRRSRLRAEEGDEALLPHGVVVRRDPRRDRHGVARGGGGAPATARVVLPRRLSGRIWSPQPVKEQ